ncbi:hypothetical protein CHUAL_008351 [Chamberlinius hualienensis]
MSIPCFLVIVATITDHFHSNKNHKLVLFCYVFSARFSFKSLFFYEPNTRNLNHLHGFRLVMTQFVIFQHVLGFFLMALPFYNQVNLYNIVDMPFTNGKLMGFYVNNFFFFLSPFLLSLNVFGKKVKLMTISDILFITFCRYVRVTLPYLFVICFIAGPLMTLSSGPIWPYTVQLQNICRSHWLEKLLYIENLRNKTNSASQCVLGEWYLSADMQLYLFAIPLIWLINKQKKLGFFCVALAVLISVTVHGVYIKTQNIPHFISLSNAIHGGNIKTQFAVGPSGQPLYRISSTGFGIATGYLFIKYQPNIKSLTKLQSIFSLSVVTFYIFFMEFIGNFYVKDHHMSKSMQIFCGTVGNIFVLLSYSVIILYCYFNPLSWLKFILSTKIAVILGKLCFGFYLFHGSAIALHFFSFKNSQEISYLNQWYNFTAVTTLSGCGALLLYLTIESPNERLFKYWFRDSKN